MSDFPISWFRECFPALNLGDIFIFFDNGAGAQIPQAALDAVQKHLILRNVQRGGRYRQSVEVDETMQRARQSVAAFLNANSADEVAFGMNATSFIRIVSLAIADIMGARREIIVTDMDHEANIATWLVLEKRGAEIRWWRMREDGLGYTQAIPNSGTASALPPGQVYYFFAETTNAPPAEGFFYLDGTTPIQIKVPGLCQSGFVGDVKALKC